MRSRLREGLMFWHSTVAWLVCLVSYCNAASCHVFFSFFPFLLFVVVWVIVQSSHLKAIAATLDLDAACLPAGCCTQTLDSKLCGTSGWWFWSSTGAREMSNAVLGGVDADFNVGVPLLVWRQCREICIFSLIAYVIFVYIEMFTLIFVFTSMYI